MNIRNQVELHNQTTIKAPIKLQGVGLHSGATCAITIKPAPADFGICFVSLDDPLRAVTRVDHQSMSGGTLGTNLLVGDDYQIRTVEHFLAAIVSLCIDNLLVEVSGGEMPILDGSSDFFVKTILNHGLCVLDAKRQVLPLSKSLSSPLRVENDFGGYIEISPQETQDVEIVVSIDFDNDCVKKMPSTISFKLSPNEFVERIGLARTFGFKKDLDHLLDIGLCLGGSLKNAILISDTSVMNKEGLRFAEELVAHKALDLIGDLAPFLAKYNGMKIVAHKPGHQLNNKLLKYL